MSIAVVEDQKQLDKFLKVCVQSGDYELLDGRKERPTPHYSVE